MTFRRCAALALGAAFAAGGCNSGTATPAAGDAAAGPVSQDQPAATADFRMRVRGVRQCTADRLHDAPPGRHWLGVDVELEGTSARRVPANPFYARLVDASGHAHASQPGPCLPGLRHAPLGRGDVARGWIDFLVPDQATGLELHYAPRIPGASDDELVFKLRP